MRFKDSIKQATLAQRFMLTSLIILIAGMTGIGVWVGNEIKNGVIHRTGVTTALYVDSFVAPLLQELGNENAPSPQNMQQLSKLLQDTPMGKQIVSFKVWNTSGQVLFSIDQQIVGQTFPIEEGLSQAIQGQVNSSISRLQKVENAGERTIRSELLETYSPVRLRGTDKVIAVAEFYQTVDALNQEVLLARRKSWFVVGSATLIIYLLLAGFVRRASDTIESQRVMLTSQVTRLSELLSQNNDLHGRVRRAAASVATLNERFLRRIGSELHDGPAQDLGLVLLKLDSLIARSEQGKVTPAFVEELTGMQTTLQNAQKEIRGISTGLSLPELTNLSVEETVIRAVRAHERRTGSRVKLDAKPLPQQAGLPVKITMYRVIQEALNNAYRHAEETTPEIQVWMDGDVVLLEVCDQGPGFEDQSTAVMNGHLGVSGMRERVESLGGTFSVESENGKGTKVMARLSVHSDEGRDER